MRCFFGFLCASEKCAGARARRGEQGVTGDRQGSPRGEAGAGKRGRVTTTRGQRPGGILAPAAAGPPDHAQGCSTISTGPRDAARAGHFQLREGASATRWRHRRGTGGADAGQRGARRLARPLGEESLGLDQAIWVMMYDPVVTPNRAGEHRSSTMQYAAVDLPAAVA